MIKYLRTLSKVMAIIIVLNLSTTIAYGEEFTTNTNAQILSEIGVFRGSDQGLELDRVPTRLEGLVMFLRMIGEEEAALSYSGQVNPFNDVPEWGTKYVEYAYDMGYTNGMSESTFGSSIELDAKTYVTLSLRALGYNDKEGDFSWSTALDKGLEVGIVEENQVESLDDFDRGQMANVSMEVLKSDLKDGEKCLAEVLLDKGALTEDCVTILGISETSDDLLAEEALLPEEVTQAPISIPSAIAQMASFFSFSRPSTPVSAPQVIPTKEATTAQATTNVATKSHVEATTAPAIEIVVNDDEAESTAQEIADESIEPETTAAPETTTAVPETTTAAPETTTAAPETTTAVPETRTVAPETTTVEPETTTVAPETTMAAPETTTAAPATTTAAPETTTAALSTTTAAPATTTAAPETTTAAPETTTAAPATTTAAPATTTAAPETTTAAPVTTTAVPETITAAPEVVEDAYSVLEAGAVADAYISGNTVYGTDSTAAFQYAVDNYDTIIIPEGNYRLSDTVTISRQVTLIGQESIIYADPINNTKTGIFYLNSGASGSEFLSMDVRSIDKYLVYMPNDTPTSLSSNLAFIYGSGSTDILVKDTETHNLMYSVHGFGMDRLEIDNCSFEENYINMWFGDVEDVYIHDSFFSTSPTADIYAHTIYVGFDTDGVVIRDLTVEQTSEKVGSILNFAWVSGNLGQYYIHNVDVDGVTILPSYTVNQVVQLYGVENATFKNITGRILDSSEPGSGTALVKMSNSNGDIRFENIDIEFDELTTLIRATEQNIQENQKVTIDNSTLTIKKQSGHFIRPFVKEVVVSNSTIVFEDGALSSGQGLLESGEKVTLENNQIYFSDYLRLSSSISQAHNSSLDITVNNNDFIGSQTNGTYFTLNGVGIDFGLDFTNNHLVNMFAEGRNTTDLSWMVHPKYMDKINGLYSGNTFDWE